MKLSSESALQLMIDAASVGMRVVRMTEASNIVLVVSRGQKYLAKMPEEVALRLLSELERCPTSTIKGIVTKYRA